MGNKKQCTVTELQKLYQLASDFELNAITFSEFKSYNENWRDLMKLYDYREELRNGKK